MELTRADIDSLHDTISNFVYETYGIKEPALSDEQILIYWEKLPRDIQMDVIKYGASDTPTRDLISVWLKENIKLE